MDSCEKAEVQRGVGYEKAAGLMEGYVQHFFSQSSVQQEYLTYFGTASSTPLRNRILDFFITQYCRECPILLNRHIHLFRLVNVYTDYKAQLKSFTKRWFNLFARTHELTIHFDAEDATTPVDITRPLGYWNYIRWLIENDILMYVRTQYAQIEKAYRECRRRAVSTVRAQHDKGKKLCDASMVRLRRRHSVNLRITRWKWVMVSLHG